MPYRLIIQLIGKRPCACIGVVTKGTAGARKEFSAAAVYTSETFTCVQQDKAIQQDKANK